MNDREKLLTLRAVGIAILAVGIIVMVVGMVLFKWGKSAEQEEKTAAVEEVEFPLSLAIPDQQDCWYKEKQMIPDPELGNGPDWRMVVNGNATEDGFDDSVAPERTKSDSDQAKSLSAKFFKDNDSGKVETLDYLENPVMIEPGVIYTLELDCTRYNAFCPVDRNTMRYYIVPINMRRGETAAITFALYDSDERLFHQICVPFKTEENIEIEYSLDEEFEKETLGQVYRLYLKAENGKPRRDVTEPD